MSISPPPGCPVAHDFDPLGQSYLTDPYPELNELREHSPVYYVPALDYWLITRHADIAAVFSDPQTFSARIAQQPLAPLTEQAGARLKAGLHNTPVLSNFDPPEHTRIRLHLAKFFLPRTTNRLRGTIEARTAELIELFADDGQVDLVSRLTFPLPAITIFTFIGFPDADTEQLKAWCEDKLEVNWGKPSPEYQLQAAENMSKFWQYCEEFVAARRVDPREDLTSALLQQRQDDPHALDDREIASVLFALSFAGHETTTNLISNCMRQLLTRPQHWQQICADPTLIPRVVEETLRIDSSVIAWRRQTNRAVSLAGVDLPAGANLMLALAAANHDPRQFPEPESFDLHRDNGRTQLSFGKGTHFCLGQHLARAEAQIVIEQLARRLPTLRLDPGQALNYSPNISFRGPTALPVSWTVS